MKLFGKTKLCHFYAAGCCKKAPRCPFAHGLEELKEQPDLKKTSICKSWQSYGCSLSADLCPFAHGKDDLAKNSARALPKRSSRKASQGSIHSVDRISHAPTGCDSNTENETADIRSDCSSSFSASGSSSLECKDLSWDPLSLNQRPVQASADFFCDQFQSHFAPCKPSDQDMQTYSPALPSLDIAGLSWTDHPQEPIVVAMAPVIVFDYWDPMGAGAYDLEEVLRSAQPEFYEE